MLLKVDERMCFKDNDFDLAKEVLRSAGIPSLGAESVYADPDTSVMIRNVLREIGVPEYGKGFSYIAVALECGSIERGSVTKLIYPEVARRFGTTAANVEKTIRFTIECTWENGAGGKYARYFANFKERPANGQFLQIVHDIIFEHILAPGTDAI